MIMMNLILLIRLNQWMMPQLLIGAVVGILLLWRIGKNYSGVAIMDKQHSIM